MNTTRVADVASRRPDLFVTSAALQQRRRPPNLQAEAAASCELSKLLAVDPRSALRHLLEIARHFCGAGSAGLSLLRNDEAGQAIVHWAAISGALASHEGADTPRDSSPCGLCLDAGMTILMSRPEREFARLNTTPPSIVETLIVPLYDNARRPLGTFWIAHHERIGRICCDDARIVEQLAVQLVLALRLLERELEHRHALALVESHRRAQQNLIRHDLILERSLRIRAETSESKMRQALALNEAVTQESHHRVKNTLQTAASLLSSHARAASSEEVRFALQESQRRLQLLAKVHELLCTSADSRQLILMPTLLQALGDALPQSFAETSARVRLHVTANELSLPANEAVAMALLANEAVTNAYKHAFPNDSSGEITVSLSRGLENALILQIADNGIGLQPRHEAGGMGLSSSAYSQRNCAARSPSSRQRLRPGRLSRSRLTDAPGDSANPSRASAFEVRPEAADPGRHRQDH